MKYGSLAFAIFAVILSILALLFAFFTPANARPRAVTSHEDLIQHLTQEEVACRAGGILVEAIAVDRDNFVPLTTTMARLRIMLATSSATYAQAMVELAQQLYATPTAKGAEWRQLFEMACLTPQAR